MYQLVYLSFSTDQFDEESDVSKILEASQKNNPDIEVTGMLLYKGGVFLQFIEGPKENVQNLFDKIGQDKRHRNVKILVKSEGNERLFGNWTMAYKKLEEININIIKNILPWNELIEKAKNGDPFSNETIMSIVKKFATHI